MSNNLKSMTIPEIGAVLKEMGQPAFRACLIHYKLSLEHFVSAGEPFGFFAKCIVVSSHDLHFRSLASNLVVYNAVSDHIYTHVCW